MNSSKVCHREGGGDVFRDFLKFSNAKDSRLVDILLRRSQRCIDDCSWRKLVPDLVRGSTVFEHLT